MGNRVWDLGFGIEDLELGIWDLDSFCPTDPSDKLGVAQLSKIGFLSKLIIQPTQLGFGHRLTGSRQFIGTSRFFGLSKPIIQPTQLLAGMWQYSLATARSCPSLDLGISRQTHEARAHCLFVFLGAKQIVALC